MANLLNLEKGQMLNLTKKEPGLVHIKFAGGWDVKKATPPVKGGFIKSLIREFTSSNIDYQYDLDLVAYLKSNNNEVIDTIYFNNRRGNGIWLDQDNRTGAGSGDDETITLDLTDISNSYSNISDITFAIIIYDALNRKQIFSNIENAFVRIYNPDDGNREICRFNLSNDGGSSTACVVGSLNKNESNEWEFKAIGDYISGDSVNYVKSVVRSRY